MMSTLNSIKNSVTSIMTCNINSCEKKVRKVVFQLLLFLL